MPRIAWGLLACIAACTSSSSVTCADGKLCAEGTTCVRVTDPTEDVCARADQLAECVGKPRYTHCGTNGRCYDGVCLPVACGNWRVDRADPNLAGDVGEVCDDGNQISGDGCSADCKSDETCGNGVIDAVRGELCDDGNLLQHDGCDSTCQPEQPFWLQLPQGGPSPRTNPAMAYDARRQRTVLFGGIDAASGAWLGDTWEWDGSGWTLLATQLAPSPRTAAAMAYDADTHTIVLYGGRGAGGADNDTWEWNGVAWTPRAVLAAPSPRSGSSMVYDSGRHRIVLYGGLSGSGSFNVGRETWEWDGSTWTRTYTNGTNPPELGPGSLPMAYDPVRGVTVLLAGDLNTGSSTWTYDGQTWTNVTNIGPTPRLGAMAYDPRSGNIMLFGGGVAGGPSASDLWAWNGASWSKAPQTTMPPARQDHAMVTDLARQSIVMFGGAYQGPTPPTPAWDASTWQWAAGLWGETPPYVPPLASNEGVARNALDGTALTFPATTLRMNDDVFAPFSTSTMPPASTNTMAYDEANDATMLYDTTGGTTWLWQRNQWTSVTPASSPPATSGTSVAWDVVGKQILLFGGNSSAGTLDTTWSWNGTTWTQLAPAHHPGARTTPQIGSDPVHGQVVVFGGDSPTSTGALNDTWLWNGADWLEATPKSSPPGTNGSSLVWLPSRQRLVMFTTGLLPATWEWDGTTWTQIAVPNAPAARAEYMMVPTYDGTGLVMYGGANFARGLFRPLNEVWLLRWSGAHAGEACRDAVDDDGDHLAGCADPDCWWACTPLCPPGATCDPAAPHCGDGVCNKNLENCRICPQDCGCTPVCGDLHCDAPSETHASCPGDCS